VGRARFAEPEMNPRKIRRRCAEDGAVPLVTPVPAAAPDAIDLLQRPLCPREIKKLDGQPPKLGIIGKID